MPSRIERTVVRPLNRIVFFAFSHVLTMRTPIGRKAGVLPGQLGRYLIGWLFRYSLASSMIHGVGRDAE